VQREKRRREDSREPEATKIDPGAITDPAVLVTGDIRVREDLARAPKREADIVALTLDGYSQEEIKEILGVRSVRAVEGVLHRWRTKENQRLGRGGGA
jgi:DNA-directed RNA polymerase specialized sigma24 family protein